MGKIKQGILGGFSGKVGPVIGASWKGKAVMRSQALSYADANTIEQQQQRAKFALLSVFLANCASFVTLGMRGVAKGMTPLNDALRRCFNANAITGTWPNYTIDYSKAILAYGIVDLPYNASAAVNGSDIDFSWSDNSNIGNALADDIVMVIAYNDDKKSNIVNTNAAQRSVRAAQLTIPTEWSGDTIKVYMALRRSKGTEASKSIFLGSFDIQ